MARWDFAIDQASDRTFDKGPLGLHGQLVNRPMRAVTGPDWSGLNPDFRTAPAEYDAISFRDDSVGDANWSISLTVAVPHDWTPGVYALRLEDDGSEEEVPFYVRPSEGHEARVLFLAPTNTYFAYANERTAVDATGSTLTEMKDEPLELSPIDDVIMSSPSLGLSLYDLHSDGRGVCYSSRLRPILNWRSTYVTWLNGAARHFAADLYLVGLLEHAGIRFDVATDEDLDRAGTDLLARYDVVLSGSHPEYVTESMLDAVREYLASGRRLMYLGGNGFYWVTSFLDPTRTTIEVRRGFKGNGNWTSEPGEQYLSSTGEPSGLWRWRGRTPHKTFGVGMGSCGWAKARPYKRTKEGMADRWAWAFDGLDADELIGTDGLALGGAAGDEMDRVDYPLGSPDDAVVLATATGFTDHYQPVIEDFVNFEGNRGGSVNPKVRADMTILPLSNGGSVFSVGSICWLSSVPVSEYDNPVATVTLNVLRRFLDPRPV